MAVLGTLLKDISVLADVNACVCNDFLTDSVKWRICYLCEKLTEIVEKRRCLLVKWRERDITSHGSNWLCTFFSHWQDRCADILI